MFILRSKTGLHHVEGDTPFVSICGQTFVADGKATAVRYDLVGRSYLPACTRCTLRSPRVASVRASDDGKFAIGLFIPEPAQVVLHSPPVVIEGEITTENANEVAEAVRAAIKDSIPQYPTAYKHDYNYVPEIAPILLRPNWFVRLLRRLFG